MLATRMRRNPPPTKALTTKPSSRKDPKIGRKAEKGKTGKKPERDGPW